MTNTQGRSPRSQAKPGHQPARTAGHPQPQHEGAPSGRRAREKAARAQAAQRRKFVIVGGGATAVVVIAIVVISFMRAPASPTSLTVVTNYNPPSQLLKTGITPPAFDLVTSDSNQHITTASLKGHVALLEFFAVWCPHCQREAPLLNALDLAEKGIGYQAVSILASPYGRNFDTSGGTDLTPVSASDVSWYKQSFAVSHPILIDPTYAAVNKYGIPGYPTIYILDKSGIIRYASTGEVTYQQLATEIANANHS